MSEDRVYYNVDGKEVDADGVPKGTPRGPQRFEVTYEVNGVERNPDGSAVDSSPVEKDQIRASGPAVAVADRAILGAGDGGRAPLSPGELALRAMRDSDRLVEDFSDLDPEQRDKLVAEIRQSHQEEHLARGASAVEDDESEEDSRENASKGRGRRKKTSDTSEQQADTNADAGGQAEGPVSTTGEADTNPAS